MPKHLKIVSHGPAALQSHPNDVICIPKRYVSDTEASQAPILILPHAFLSRLPEKVPQDVRPYLQVPLEKRKTWLDLADALLRSGTPTWKTKRSVDYLIKVGQGIQPEVFLPEMPWHEEDKNAALLDTSSPTSFPLLLPVATLKANLRA